MLQLKHIPLSRVNNDAHVEHTFVCRHVEHPFILHYMHWFVFGLRVKPWAHWQMLLFRTKGDVQVWQTLVLLQVWQNWTPEQS